MLMSVKKGCGWGVEEYVEVEKGWRGVEKNHRYACVWGGGKHAECASHLIEPRSALSPPSSPSVRLVLRLAGETARRRCVDVSGYSQQPRLIVCDSCPC